jgi:hypothetical protein
MSPVQLSYFGPIGRQPATNVKIFSCFRKGSENVAQKGGMMPMARRVDADADFCWRTDGGELFLEMNGVALTVASRNGAQCQSLWDNLFLEALVFLNGQ